MTFIQLFHGGLIFCSFGLLCEVVFTGVFDAIRTLGKSYKAEVSLLMIVPYFVGYIAGVTIVDSISHNGAKIFVVVSIVYIVEYYFGSVYRYFKICPWKYDHKFKLNNRIIRLDINGLITFAYLPFWLIFAKIALQIHESIKVITQ